MCARRNFVQDPTSYSCYSPTCRAVTAWSKTESPHLSSGKGFNIKGLAAFVVALMGHTSGRWIALCKQTTHIGLKLLQHQENAEVCCLLLAYCDHSVCVSLAPQQLCTLQYAHGTSRQPPSQPVQVQLMGVEKCRAKVCRTVASWGLMRVEGLEIHYQALGYFFEWRRMEEISCKWMT